MKGLTYGLAALVVSASAVSALSLLAIDAGQTSTNQQVEVEEVAKIRAARSHLSVPSA